MKSFTVVDIIDLSYFCKYVDRTKVKKYIKIKTDDYSNLIENINWNELSKHHYLSEDFMFRYQIYLSWPEILRYQKLSHEFLRNQLGKVYLHKELVSRYQLLSEAAMDEFAELLDWNLISYFQIMSEDFMEKHAHRLNWNTIFSSGKYLSKNFREKNLHRVRTELDGHEDGGFDVVG